MNCSSAVAEALTMRLIFESCNKWQSASSALQVEHQDALLAAQRKAEEASEEALDLASTSASLHFAMKTPGLALELRSCPPKHRASTDDKHWS